MVRSDKLSSNKCCISGRAHKTVAWFYQSTVHLNTIKTQFVWKHKTRFSPLIVRWDTTSWTFQFSALLKIITRVLFSDEYEMSCWNNFGGRSLGTPGRKYVYHDLPRSLSLTYCWYTQGSLRIWRTLDYQQASCVNPVYLLRFAFVCWQ